jgi:hypothetical protein
VVQVSSRRALRADPAFDALVRTLYPDMEDYEAKEVEFISQARAARPGVAHVSRVLCLRSPRRSPRR